jgi:hypothetical protein
MNITIVILDIIHHPEFYSKYDVSETAFCPRFRVGTDSCLRNVAFQIKDRTMDGVQNCDSYIKTDA